MDFNSNHARELKFGTQVNKSHMMSIHDVIVKDDPILNVSSQEPPTSSNAKIWKCKYVKKTKYENLKRWKCNMKLW